IASDPIEVCESSQRVMILRVATIPLYCDLNRRRLPFPKIPFTDCLSSRQVNAKEQNKRQSNSKQDSFSALPCPPQFHLNHVYPVSSVLDSCLPGRPKNNRSTRRPTSGRRALPPLSLVIQPSKLRGSIFLAQYYSMRLATAFDVYFGSRGAPNKAAAFLVHSWCTIACKWDHWAQHKSKLY